MLEKVSGVLLSAGHSRLHSLDPKYSLIPLVHLRKMGPHLQGPVSRWFHLLNMGVLSPIANEEYYQLLMSSESQPCSVDVPSYTMEQVEGITSEYIVKNAVSQN